VSPSIAVFGGSFDPPHLGHVFLALYARSVGDVARVIVAPTFQHAFGKTLSDFDQRLALCELAFAPIDGVEVSPIERELGGVSRTLRLVETLAARHPDHTLRLLIGADILLEAPRWQHFDRIVARAPLLVAGRGGYARPSDAAAVELPEVSSSEVRSGLARGADVSGLVPARVLAHIAAHGLYRDGAP
jgi:nicotinate-nucleotide adenylyltransferase